MRLLTTIVLALAGLSCGSSMSAAGRDAAADSGLGPDQDFTATPECDAFCARLVGAQCPGASTCDRTFWCGRALSFAPCGAARRAYLACASQGTFTCVASDASSGVDIAAPASCLQDAVNGVACSDASRGD